MLQLRQPKLWGLSGKKRQERLVVLKPALAHWIRQPVNRLMRSTSASLNWIKKAVRRFWQCGQKAGVDGITAGIGIVAGKDSEGRPVSQVAISASQLFVFDPNNPDNTAYPFAVSGGKVVIPKAMIYDAVIETLVSRKVVADEVKAGVSITSPVIRSAVIQNGNFQVDSQGNLNIGGLFSVTSQGQLTIRYSNQNVGLVIRNDKIEVYDQNGRLAVRIGRLR